MYLRRRLYNWYKVNLRNVFENDLSEWYISWSKGGLEYKYSNRFISVSSLLQYIPYIIERGREGNLPGTASEPHFTYLRHCASKPPPKQSSLNDLPFVIVNFGVKQD